MNNMAAACALTWLPETLYNSCITAAATAYPRFKNAIRDFPPHVQFDVYEKIYRDGRLCQLSYEFCDLDIFFTVLSVQQKWYELHQYFQALVDHGVRLPQVLVDQFRQRCNSVGAKQRFADESITQKLILNGYAFASFLAEAGWYKESAKCTEACLDLCRNCCDSSSLRVQGWIIEAYVWILEAYNGYCRYEDAMRIFRESLSFVDRLKERHTSFCFAELYIQFSSLFFNLGRYDEAFEWAVKALRQLWTGERIIDRKPSAKTVIRVFCQASKVLVVRRQFRQGEMLIKHAVALTHRHYERCKRYPSPLLDFGFYLMNVDLNEPAARVCQIALDYRQAQFGGKNLKLAHAYEDLAYATYVYEYSTGHFAQAREHADRAITILSTYLPDNHLLLASCRRVKALILEEIAIDSHDKMYEASLLHEAEELHLNALAVCKRLFGEDNIQTAKHYGNLGRLYQSLRRYEEAEAMHLKAVEIKQRLLGADDYEVALSMGHLASLYNYDMGRYTDAEELYLKSISIGKRLFGESYSGLEYDYRGLVHVYSHMNDRVRAGVYIGELHNWKLVRDNELARANPLTVLTDQYVSELEDTQQLLTDFFKKFL